MSTGPFGQQPYQPQQGQQPYQPQQGQPYQPQQGQQPYQPQQGRPYQPQQGQPYQPQQGQPYQQQPYQPQQRPYNPQGGYSGPGGMPPGFRPSAPQPARSGGSNGKIIGIVAGALVVVLLIGAGFMFLGRSSTPTPVSPITPTPVNPGTPGTTTTQPATPTPSPGPTTKSTPASGAVDLGKGVSVTPAAGWTIEDQNLDRTIFVKGNAFFIAQALTAKAGLTGPQIADAYITSQASKMTNTKRTEVKTLDVHPSLSVGQAQISGTATGSSGSYALGLSAVVSVRTSDQVTAIGIIGFDPGADLTEISADYQSMMGSMMQSQVT